MTKSSEADVVLIGVGTCGEDVALQLLGAGLDVVGVEVALVGGECPYWACLPAKRMIRMGNLLEEAKRADGAAGRTSVTPAWSVVAEQITAEVTGGWDDSGAMQRFADRGGRLIKARGRLAGAGVVEAGAETITARKGVIIATGSQPVIPDIAGLADVEYWTTREAISARELPDSMIILGGGTVGCEFGQLFARFGTDVTLIEGADRIIAKEEPEASVVALAALEEAGVSVRVGVRVERVGSTDDAVTVTLSDGTDLRTDRILLATGRRVDLSSLGLETVGLDGSAPFLDVDDQMRAGDRMWAMGDVTAKAMFTHVALAQAAVVVASLLERDHPPVRYDALPRVTFTDPEIAAVGLTESEARAAGIDVAVVMKHVPATFRGWLHRSGNSGVIKLVVDRAGGTLVGATAAGPSGGEVLGMLALAVHARVPLSELRSMVYAFPTFHGGVGAAVGAWGRGLDTVFDPGYDGVTILDTIG